MLGEIEAATETRPTHLHALDDSQVQQIVI